MHRGSNRHPRQGNQSHWPEAGFAKPAMKTLGAARLKTEVARPSEYN